MGSFLDAAKIRSGLREKASATTHSGARHRQRRRAKSISLSSHANEKHVHILPHPVLIAFCTGPGNHFAINIIRQFVTHLTVRFANAVITLPQALVDGQVLASLDSLTASLFSMQSRAISRGGRRAYEK